MEMCEADRSWFAMRATYGRNLMAQRALEMDNLESFVPMRKRTVKLGRRIKTDMIPVVRDLIFVLGERDVIQEAKSRIPYLHYITRPAEGKNMPIEVPDEQMQQFIAVCREMDNLVMLVTGGDCNTNNLGYNLTLTLTVNGPDYEHLYDAINHKVVVPETEIPQPGQGDCYVVYLGKK
jgi:hypothetical protein